MRPAFLSGPLLRLNLAHITMDGLYDAVPILLSFMVLYYGAGEKDAGLIVSLGAFCSTMGGMATRFFSSRLGLWRAIGCILGCFGIGFFANAFTTNLTQTGIFFVLALSGMGLFHSLTFAHLTVHSDRRWLGKVIGDFTAIGDVGRIPIASLAGFGAALTLAGLPGWRAVCFLYGLAALSMALWLYLYQNKDQELLQERKESSPKGGVLPSFALLRRRPLAQSMLANMLDGFASAHIFTFLPFLLFAKGVDPKVIGGFALTFALGSLTGKVLCGRLAGYMSPRAVFVVAELLMVALLVAIIMVESVAAVLGVSLALGIVTRGTVPVLQAIMVEPAQNKNECEDVYSLSSLFRGGVNMCTPLLFGILAAAFSIEGVYALMAVAGTLAVLPIALPDGSKGKGDKDHAAA